MGVPPTQNPGNVVAKMGHLNAAAELHRKGLEAKERTLGPDHPETLLVDLGLSSFATFLHIIFCMWYDFGCWYEWEVLYIIHVILRSQQALSFIYSIFSLGKHPPATV